MINLPPAQGEIKQAYLIEYQLWNKGALTKEEIDEFLQAQVQSVLAAVKSTSHSVELLWVPPCTHGNPIPQNGYAGFKIKWSALS